jgi:hypothetical protein
MQIKLGPKLFSFSSHLDWVNHASTAWKKAGVSSIRTICLDQQQRICAWGEHFAIAKDEAQFPVDVYAIRDDMELPEGFERG